MNPRLVPRRRPGFTLLEMTTVLGLFSILVVMGTALMLTAVRANRSAGRSLHRAMVRGPLADRFRGDVAAATAATITAPQAAGQGPVLTLRLAANEQVVYQWQDGSVERVHQAGDKKLRQKFAAGADCQGVEFVAPEGDRSIVTLRFLDPAAGGKAASTLEITAALGGDLR